MMNVKLIEVVNQVSNYVEVIATVQKENQKEYLGFTEFTLPSNQTLPKDEDEIAKFLETMNLTWDLYIPNFDELPVSV